MRGRSENAQPIETGQKAAISLSPGFRPLGLGTPLEVYPCISDPHFHQRIATISEFHILSSNDGLYHNQEFVRRFMGPRTPYQSLFLFHKLGSGKSISCIAIAIDHYLHDGKTCVVLTRGPSGAENFVDRIKQFSEMTQGPFQGKPSELCKLFRIEHYISMSNTVSTMEDEDVSNLYSNCIIVLDELHNVKRDEKEDLKSVYGSVMRIISTSRNRRVLITTGTPMTDHANQLMPILKLLRIAYPPEDTYGSIDEGIEAERLRAAIHGVVSYNPITVGEPNVYHDGKVVPGLSRPVYLVTMKGIQMQRWLEREDNSVVDIYRSIDQISLFVDDHGRFGREILPREDYFPQDPMFEWITETVPIARIASSSHEARGQNRGVQGGFVRVDIKSSRLSVVPDKRHMVRTEFLDQLSCKYHALMKSLDQLSGLAFVFIEEVLGSGLLVLCAILEARGYELYRGDAIEALDKKRRYTFCTGDKDYSPNNEERLKGFEHLLNAKGEYVQILVGSRVIGESISLQNVVQFHGMIPHWNHTVMDQAIGRTIRSHSHDQLPYDERNVTIRIYAAFTGDRSSDIFKLMACDEKQVGIQANEDVLKRYCIEAELLGQAGWDGDESLDKYSMDHRSLVALRMPEVVPLLLDDIDDCMATWEIIDVDKLSAHIATNRYPFTEEVVEAAIRRIVGECILLPKCNAFLKCFSKMLYLTEDPFCANEHPGSVALRDGTYSIPGVQGWSYSPPLGSVASGKTSRPLRGPTIDRVSLSEVPYPIDSIVAMVQASLSGCISAIWPPAELENQRRLHSSFPLESSPRVLGMLGETPLPEFCSFLSLTDGKIRLRLPRQSEERVTQKGVVDRRTVSRGRTIQTYNKTLLKGICERLGIPGGSLFRRRQDLKGLCEAIVMWLIEADCFFIVK